MGFDLVDNKIEIIVFPNPASTVLNISNIKSAPQKINFYNTLGELVYTCENTKDAISVDISNFAKGVYFVSIVSSYNEILGTTRFVKE